MNFYSMDDNTFLYKQDESIADFLYVLIEGRVKIYRNFKEVDTIEAPHILGDAALLQGSLRTHSVLSLEKIKICQIHKN